MDRRSAVSLLLVTSTLQAIFPNCATAQNAPTKPAATVYGDWVEYWGNDDDDPQNYQVSKIGNGVVTVREIIRKFDPGRVGSQKIRDEKVAGNTLTFVSERDAFDVTYLLTLQPGGKQMVGTATTTTNKVIPIRWQRANPSA